MQADLHRPRRVSNFTNSAHVPRGLARVVSGASSGFSGQGCFGWRPRISARTAFQDPAQKPGRSLVACTGRRAGEQGEDQGVAAVARRSDGRPGRTAPARAPRRSGRPRRRSRWRCDWPVGAVNSGRRGAVHGAQGVIGDEAAQGAVERVAGAAGRARSGRAAAAPASPPAARRAPRPTGRAKSPASMPAGRRRGRGTAASPRSRAGCRALGQGLLGQAAGDQGEVGLDGAGLDDQRAEPRHAPGLQPAAGVGGDLGLHRHPVGEGGGQFGLVEGGGQQDAVARRAAAELADRQPGFARQRPRAAPDRRRGRWPAGTRRACRAPWRPAPDRRRPAARASEAGPAPRSGRCASASRGPAVGQGQGVGAAAAALALQPLEPIGQVDAGSAEAAFAQHGGDARRAPGVSAAAPTTSISASRGCSGRADSALPWAVSAPAASSAPSRDSSPLASLQAASGGGSRKARPSASLRAPLGQGQGEAGQIGVEHLGPGEGTRARSRPPPTAGSRRRVRCAPPGRAAGRPPPG